MIIRLEFKQEKLLSKLPILSRFKIALTSLILVLDHILLLQLAHALDLIQIHHETLLVRVKLLNAFAAENGGVVGAVEMLHAVWVLLAQLFIKAFLVFIFKIEASLVQNLILLNYLVEDVDVEGKALS